MPAVPDDHVPHPHNQGPVPVVRPRSSTTTGAVSGVALGLCVGGFLTGHTVPGIFAGVFFLVLFGGAVRTFRRPGVGDRVPTPVLRRAQQDGRTVALRVDGRWPRLFGAHRLPVRRLPTEIPNHRDERGDNTPVPFPYAVTVVPRDGSAYRTRMLIEDDRVLDFPLDSVHVGVIVEEGYPDVAVVPGDRSTGDGAQFPPLSGDLPVRPPERPWIRHLSGQGMGEFVVRNALTAVVWGLVVGAVVRWLG